LALATININFLKEKNMQGQNQEKNELPDSELVSDITKWTPEQVKSEGVDYILQHVSDDEIRQLKRDVSNIKIKDLPNSGLDSPGTRTTTKVSGILAGFEVYVEKVEEHGLVAILPHQRDDFVGEPNLSINGIWVDSRIADPLLEKIKSALTMASSMHAVNEPW
jgi:hypothetical protein